MWTATLNPNAEERKPLIAAAAERNKDAILGVLKEILPNDSIQILELASGGGEHVVHFAKNLPKIQWQPSDIDPSYIQSMSSSIETLGLKNVNQPVVLNVLNPISEWPSDITERKNFYDVILCFNMMHIAPWACTLGLFSAANYLLKEETGLLITYGPYAVDGVITADSNVNFDKYLKNENPEWGLRDVRDLTEVGSTNGLKFQKSIDMPANNKVLVFKKETS